ncbi:MAG: hypothetical protein RLZZ610_875 [Actinomycetota bacterium]|jgi:hypothetical protein
MKSRAAHFELVGGLGNQLFIYAASRYLSERLKIQTATFWGQKKRGDTTHLSSLTSFDLPGPRPKGNGLVLRVSLKVRQGIRRGLKLAGVDSDLAERIANLHTPKGLGQDIGLHKVKPGWIVTGYFQTSEYYQWLREYTQEFPLQLRNPSSWYLDMERQIIEESPTVIHVRRGDYLLDSNKQIGALSEQYYLSGLLATLEKDSNRKRPIWIFTDDPIRVKAEFAQLTSFNIRWVDAPKNSDPAESLLLMSKGEAIVISNSTFSWWAAALGQHRKVVAPSEWFRHMPEPEGLLLSQWTRAPSTWLEGSVEV